MLVKPLLLFVAYLAITASAFAGEKTFEYSCGKTQFKVTATPYEDDGSLGLSKIIIYAKSGKEFTRLIFDNEKRTHQAEYFAAGCISSQKRNYFVFQNHCGGSGCREDSYGIIDAKSLEVLLTPSMANQTLAERILGTKIPSIETIDPNNSVKRDAP